MTLVSPVFIHGWAFSSRVFKSYKGIKVDLPAHGMNRERYLSFERMVEDIALKLPSRHDIVGWSLGGTVALLLALKFPDKVRKLFLIGVSPYFRGAWSATNLRAFRMMIKRRGISAFRELAFGKGFDDFLEEESAMKMLDDYINLDLRYRIPYIRKEVFILQGEDDRIVPVKESLKLHNLIKGSKLIILPGGHFPAEDEKSLFSALLKIG